MSQLRPCPSCDYTFVSPPGRCPNCDTEVAGVGPPPAPGEVVVVQYRLNRLGVAGGAALAGLLWGAVSWFLGQPTLGAGLLLLGLVTAGATLLRE